jgi:hypothetical protein
VLALWVTVWSEPFNMAVLFKEMISLAGPIFYSQISEINEIRRVCSYKDQFIHGGNGRYLSVGERGRLPQGGQARSFNGMPSSSLRVVG